MKFLRLKEISPKYAAIDEEKSQGLEKLSKLWHKDSVPKS
jgi:hypothetical protein